MRSAARQVGFVAVLVALLATMAVLQYRWTDQLAAVERERMQATLGARAHDFGRDFDRELTRAFAWLRAEPPEPGSPPDTEPTARIRRWFDEAPHAAMVSTIYEVRDGPGRALHIAAYDREADRFVECDWPETLATFRRRLEGDARGQEGASARPWRAMSAPVLPDVPALVLPHPLLRVIRTGEREITLPLDLGPSDSGPRALVAVLDRAYLRDSLLPALEARYFALDDAFAFDLAVVDRATGEVVYASSTRDLVASPRDAEVTLFAIRFEEFGRFVVQTRFERRDVPDGGSPTDTATIQDRRPRPGREDPPVGPREANRFSAMVLTDTPGGREAQGAWQLLVTHRAGSLEAAVAASRQRNLALSFGVLALLGVSMMLVLVSARRAEQLARQQMEFVAGVSHELRTPLAVIRSAGENLADGVVSDPPQVRRYGAVVATEGRRLTEMVEQVMEFAGFGAGRGLRERTVASVASIVEQALITAQPTLDEAGVEVETRIDDAVPAVDGDAAALARAVRNLVTNAAKYASSGRWVGVSVSRAATASRQEVVVEVADRGPGIPPDELPRVFEPFFRGAQALAAQVHGNGLGLSLVKRIVEAHGGRVEVRSRPAEGCTFAIHLPAAATASRRERAATTDVAAAGGLPAGHS